MVNFDSVNPPSDLSLPNPYPFFVDNLLK